MKRKIFGMVAVMALTGALAVGCGNKDKDTEKNTSKTETNAPETTAPQTQGSETNAPETTAPQTQGSEANAPETAAPETQKDVTTTDNNLQEIGQQNSDEAE